MAVTPMKKFGFNLKYLLLVCSILCALPGVANPTKRKAWVPNVTTFQYAGNIAQFSIGGGWTYAKDRWMTEALLGRVPRFNTSKTKYTLTIRQTYTPWRLNLPITSKRGDAWTFSPFYCGLYMNTVLGSKQFWTEEPKSKYGGDYYKFSTRVRFALTFGERLQYHLPETMRNYGESMEVYYELSINELTLISAFPNRHMKFSELFSLGIGARWHL